MTGKSTIKTIKTAAIKKSGPKTRMSSIRSYISPSDEMQCSAHTEWMHNPLALQGRAGLQYPHHHDDDCWENDEQRVKELLTRIIISTIDPLNAVGVVLATAAT